MFVTISNAGTKINAGENVKNLINKGVCDKIFIWNCECECDKTCDLGEYLIYSNCKCRKKLVDKLVEECIKIFNEAKIAEITENNHKCSSCTLYLVLFSIIFTINVANATYFFYSH